MCADRLRIGRGAADDEAQAESGSCSDDDVFATYATEEQHSEAVGTTKELNRMATDSGLEPAPVLFGPNWSINTTEAATLAKTLGGTVVR